MSFENSDVKSDLKKMSLDQQKVVIPVSQIDVAVQATGTVFFSSMPVTVCPLARNTIITYGVLSSYNKAFARNLLEPYDGPEWVMNTEI